MATHSSCFKAAIQLCFMAWAIFCQKMRKTTKIQNTDNFDTSLSRMLDAPGQMMSLYKYDKNVTCLK
jgi:hypothetical protein